MNNCEIYYLKRAGYQVKSRWYTQSNKRFFLVQGQKIKSDE